MLSFIVLTAFVSALLCSLRSLGRAGLSRITFKESDLFWLVIGICTADSSCSNPWRDYDWSSARDLKVAVFNFLLLILSFNFSSCDCIIFWTLLTIFIYDSMFLAMIFLKLSGLCSSAAYAKRNYNSFFFSCSVLALTSPSLFFLLFGFFFTYSTGSVFWATFTYGFWADSGLGEALKVFLTVFFAIRAVTLLRK
jgi:hypothetical protein